MNYWFPAILTIVINIVVVAFAFGKLSQSVADIKARLGLADAAIIRKNDKDDTWKEKMANIQKIHEMLPTCVEAFDGIRHELGELSGKVDTLIKLTRN
jgi:hypothetical protein